MQTDIAALGTILGIWAHPDDEAYLSGGLMALARANGQRVVCVTATRGELGTADPVAWPPDRLAAERTRELAECLAILGVREHHWLAYRDGGCADGRPVDRRRRLAELIARIRPDTVLTFGPDGLTGHPDHQAVSAWTGAAFAEAAAPGARLLHATIADAPGRRRPRTWASTHPATRSAHRTGNWPSTSCWHPPSPPGRPGRWPRRRPRPPGSSPCSASTPTRRGSARSRSSSPRGADSTWSAAC